LVLDWLKYRLSRRYNFEIYIFHEALSEKVAILIKDRDYSINSPYYTSAFLVLPQSTSTLPSSNRILCKTTANQSFVLQGNHIGFRQTLEPSALILSTTDKDNNLQKAMIVFDLKPYYHLTELGSTFFSKLAVTRRLGIISHAHQSWNNSRERRVSVSIQQSSRRWTRLITELSNQSRPQLQLLAASDVCRSARGWNSTLAYSALPYGRKDVPKRTVGNYTRK
jgi:hypothetical protein